jgi:O-antigen/teichoic acid export membrane protein
MMVFGSGRFRDRLSSYFAVLATFHWCISAAISVGLAAAGAFFAYFGSAAAGLSILGYALAAPALLLLWLARRTVYLWYHPRLAVAAGVTHLTGLLIATVSLHRTGVLSPFTAPLAVAGASVAGTGIILSVRGFRLWANSRGAFLREVAVAHWEYGRWATVASMTSWASGGLYYLLIIPVLAGLASNAALNALWNLVMPMIQFNFAVSLLLIPAFGRARREHRVLGLVRMSAVVMVGGAALYAVFVALAGSSLMNIAYGGRYSHYSDLAWLVGLAALPNAASTVFEAALRAHERPDRLLWTYAVSAMVACAVGAAAVAAWGVVGGILGLLARDATTALIEFRAVFRIVIRPSGLPPSVKAPLVAFAEAPSDGEQPPL